MKRSLFSDDTIIYVKKILKNPQKAARSEFNQFESYMINVKRPIVFLYASNKQLEIDKKSLLSTMQNHEILKAKFNKIYARCKNYNTLLKEVNEDLN